MRHFSETKLVQLQVLRAALEALPLDDRRAALQRLSREHGVASSPPTNASRRGSVRRAGGRAPAGAWATGGGGAEGLRPRDGAGPPWMRPDGDGPPRVRPDGEPPDADGPLRGLVTLVTELESRLNEALGPGVEVRVQPRAQVMWVKLPAGGTSYWVGFPLPPRAVAEPGPTRALVWSLALVAALLVAAFVFARYLARPLRDLEAAVQRVGAARPRRRCRRPVPRRSPR